MRRRSAGLVGLILLALATAGCDNKTSTVSGTVTFDGVAIEDGAITFVPVDGSTPTAGGPIKNGHYSVQVPVTTMRVSITAPKVVGTKKIYDTDDSPVMPITQEALPAKYNEKITLTLEIMPGKNTRDFELKSE